MPLSLTFYTLPQLLSFFLTLYPPFSVIDAFAGPTLVHHILHLTVFLSSFPLNLFVAHIVLNVLGLHDCVVP